MSSMAARAQKVVRLDDENLHCFTLSKYDRQSGEWNMEKAPNYRIID